jgi:hypothetical protein
MWIDPLTAHAAQPVNLPKDSRMKNAALLSIRGRYSAIHNVYICTAIFDYRHLYGLIVQALRLYMAAMFASVALHHPKA